MVNTVKSHSSFILFFIIDLSIITMINTHFFKSKKMEIDIKELLLEQIEQEKLGRSNECMISESEARIILKEKYNINPDYIDIDENIRFILGKCYPIVYAPGLYASRIVATINCPVLKKDFMHFVKMRLFCSNTICANETNTYEEYVIFPSFYGTPFQLRVNDKYNKFTACQAYFYTFYNTRTECPENNCEYSDGIRINYYGATKETKSYSKCGIKAQEDVLYGGDLFPTYITNKLINDNFYVMIQAYRNIGFNDGFSAAGVSFDYRRYFHSFKSFGTSLEYTINRLYRNTGKPVIIITHSLGGLLVYNELLKMSPKLKKKIKGFVPIVPPFAGASHLLEAYLYGLPEFDSEIKILNILVMKTEATRFSESMYFSSTPIVGELRPRNGNINALEKPEYAKLKKAIQELIEVEKECGDTNCPADKVKEMTKTYYELFGDDFPSLADKDCQIGDKEINDIEYNENNGEPFFTRKCLTHLYDIIQCPLILYKNDFGYNITAEEIMDICGIYNTSLLYIKKSDTCEPKNYKDIFGITINQNYEKNSKKDEDEKTPIDSIFEGNAKYPYGYNEFDILLEEYNNNFAEKYNRTLTKDDFDSEEEFQKKAKLNVEYVLNNSDIQELTIPPIDTYLVYGAYHHTDVAYVYNKTDRNKTVFENTEYLQRGGDGTVPIYSTLLTGMKWLYDKKMNNLSQEIKLIEYCALHGKDGSKYAYNNETFKNKTYIALKCDCINQDYKSYNDIDCTHSAIPRDSVLINMIKQELIFDDNNLYDYNEDKRNAIKIYNKSINYEQVCNEALYFLNREDMEPVDWF